MDGKALRDVTEDEIREFEENGVVCLRQIIPQPWVDKLETSMTEVFGEFDPAKRPWDTDFSDERVIAMHGGTGELLADRVTDEAAKATGGRSKTMIGATSFNEDMRDIALHSPLPRIVAQLSRSERVNFYDDQLFLKQPGSALRTAFHQDRGYFRVQGDKVLVCWFTCDEVTKENGAMGYVPGSHKWDHDYKPVMVISRKSIPGSDGEEMPNIEADEDGYGVRYFDVKPGDLLVHNYRTIHGSSGNVTSKRIRRAASIRYAGDDVVYWDVPGAPPMPHWNHELHNGDPLAAPQFPQVFPVEA